MTAVVLCGGAGRRFGGDKTRADLAGSPVLDHVLDGLPADWPVVCVGEPRPTARGRSAGAARTHPAAARWPPSRPRSPTSTARVVVRARRRHAVCRGPAPGLASRLAAGPDLEAVLGRDGDGRLQPLLAAYRTEALREAVPEPAAGTPLMRLLDSLRTLVVALPEGAALDVDTTEDLERARHRLDP